MIAEVTLGFDRVILVLLNLLGAKVIGGQSMVIATAIHGSRRFKFVFTKRTQVRLEVLI